LVGGPVGAVVGAGTGAAVQQAQNKDACGKWKMSSYSCRHLG
jgi:hypothetical protein